MRPLLALTILFVATQALALEPPKTEEQKTLYAIGQTVSRQLSVFNLTPDEFQYVLLGLTDAQSGNKAAAEPAQYNQKIQELARARRAAHAQKLGPANKEALEKAAREQGAVKTASGMMYLPVKEGGGRNRN
jgi:FKBP-type peptidyl-prolyl cis-trans isomerase FkpA